MKRQILQTFLQAVVLWSMLAVCRAGWFSRKRRQTELENIFTPEQHEQFQRDGYIVVSGMLEDADLEELVRSAEAVIQQSRRFQEGIFSVMQIGMICYKPPSNDSKYENSEHDHQTDCKDNVCVDSKRIVQAFRQVALRSKFGKASAELMQLDPATHNVRLLRDVFLAKPVESEKICDWHVDDQIFWPESFFSSASEISGKDQSGINVWLAMDDMPASYEGSMALSPGSHRAPWRYDGYLAIGQNRSTPGGYSREKLLELFRGQREKKNSTCTMNGTDPDLRATIEKTKVVLDLKKGDAVFTTRMLFHRTLSVTDAGREYHNRTTGKDFLNRYSLRYVPGTARLPEGFNLEKSMMFDEANGGKTLDEVVQHKRPLWYPRIWPSLDDSLDERLDNLAMNELVEATKKREAEMATMRERMQANEQKQGHSSHYS